MQATFLHIVDQNEAEADENTQKRKRPKCSHLERTSLVKKSIYYMCTFITEFFFLRDQRGKSRAGKMFPPCPLGWPIWIQDSRHLARSWIQPCDKKSQITVGNRAKLKILDDHSLRSWRDKRANAGFFFFFGIASFLKHCWFAAIAS